MDTLISLIEQWDRDNGSVSSVLPVAVPADPIKILDVLMKENKVNASDLATSLGISQSGMSDILNYRRELTPDILSKLSQRFGVKLEG